MLEKFNLVLHDIRLNHLIFNLKFNRLMKNLIITSIAILSISGCASILNEKTQSVNVSTPNSVPVSGTVNGQPFTAPGVVVLTREGKNKVFVANSPKCKGETIAEKSVDTTFFINFLSGGPFGSTTDYSTEKMWRYADTVALNCK